MSTQQTIRVLLVDDDDRVRRGWQMRLALEPDITVVGTVGDMETAVATTAATLPDIILLDIKLPGTDGLNGIKDLRRVAPNCAIIVITVYDSLANEKKALVAGARAFVSKQVNIDQLVTLIRQISFPTNIE